MKVRKSDINAVQRAVDVIGKLFEDTDAYETAVDLNGLLPDTARGACEDIIEYLTRVHAMQHCVGCGLDHGLKLD